MPKSTPKTSRKLTTEQEEIQKSLETADAIDAVALSKGGKVIIENLVKDIVTLVEILGGKYKKLTTAELLAHCADLKSKLDVLRILTRAGKNKDFLREQLEDALKE